MIRKFLGILTVLSALAAAAPALAADPVMFDEFRRICLNNRTNLERAADAALSSGYRAADPANAPANGVTRLFVGTVSGQELTLVVRSSTVPNANVGLTQKIVTCTVMGSEPATAAKTALARWVNLPTWEVRDGKERYLFSENGGRRALSGTDSESMAALNAGGYYMTDAGTRPSDGATVLGFAQVTKLP